MLASVESQVSQANNLTRGARMPGNVTILVFGRPLYLETHPFMVLQGCPPCRISCPLGSSGSKIKILP